MNIINMDIKRHPSPGLPKPKGSLVQKSTVVSLMMYLVVSLLVSYCKLAPHAPAPTGAQGRHV